MKVLQEEHADDLAGLAASASCASASASGVKEEIPDKKEKIPEVPKIAAPTQENFAETPMREPVGFWEARRRAKRCCKHSSGSGVQ